MGAAKDYDQKRGKAAPYIETTPAPEPTPPSAFDQLISGDVQGLLGRLGVEPAGQTNTPEFPSDLSANFENMTPGEGGIVNNAIRDIGEWGGQVASDYDAFSQAKTNEEFANGAWKLYEDVADPAMMVAATPAIPPQLRVAAGLLAAPKFASDVVNTYQDNLSGEATGQSEGVLGSAVQTGKQLIIDPVTGLASNLVNRPGEMAQEISEHPAELWRQVLMPGMMVHAPVEAGIRKGRKMFKEAREESAVPTKEQMQTDIDDANAAYERWKGEKAEAEEQAKAEAARTAEIQGQVGGLYDNLMNLVDEYGNPVYEEPVREAPRQETPSSNGFDAFMEGVSRQESHGDYNVENDRTGAHGRYQILPENWSNWAEEAGLDSWAERTPENQDIVARHKLEQYYNEYGPEGALAAWYAGPVNGERWARGETTDSWGRPWDAPQENGPSIAEYVRSASAHAEEARGEVEPLTEKYYNITDEVSDAGLTDLTEQKLNLLARDYEREFGERLDLTSMKRNGDGSSWHDSGQAFDIANERLAKDPQARAWLMERAQEYGLTGLDEYANPSAHATGPHMHFSDHGEPLKGGATRSQPVQRNMGETETPTSNGELTDMFGRDFSDETMGRVNEAATKLDERINSLYAERERLMQDSSTPEVQRYHALQKVERDITQAEAYRSQMDEAMGGRIRTLSDENVGASTGRGGAVRDTYLDDVISRTKGKRSADIEGVRQYRDTLAHELRSQLNEEVERMKRNPGGKGVDRGYTLNDRGEINGRWAQSRNPQWYQDAYKEYGGEPPKSAYERIAYDNLRKNQEFAEMDRNLRRADEYLRRFEENPMGDLDAMMEDVDNLISYDRSAKASKKRKQREEISAMYDAEAETSGMLKAQDSRGTSNPAGNGMETIKNKDYFTRMRELFGTLRLGRTPKDAKGIYNGATDVARANEWGNYDTMWHEIGHRLDKQHDLSSMGNKHPREMVAALERKYGNDIPYEPSKYTSEGIAEFIKDYVQDPKSARENFPGMTKDFESLLASDKDLAGRIKEAQDMSRIHKEQPTGAKITGGIVKEEPKTFKEKAKAFLHDFMPNWVDDKQGIKRAEKEIEKIIGRKLTSDESAYIYSRIAKDRGVSAATQLLTGKDPQAVKDALNKLYGGCVKNAVTLPQIVESLEEVAKSNKDWLKAQGLADANEALSAYTVAQRFMEVYNLKYGEPLKKLKEERFKAEQELRQAESKEAEAKAKLKGSKWNTGRVQAQREYEAAHKATVEARAKAKKAAHAVEAKEEMGYKMPLKYEEYQEFVDNAPEALKKAAQGVYDLNENIVDIMHHEGIISDETHKYLKDNHKHYVSLAREFPDDAAIGKDSFAPSASFINVGKPFEKLSEEGSFKDVKDPMQQMAKNIFNSLSLVERNKVGRKLADLSNLKGVGGIVEKVPGDASTKDSTFYVWRDGKKEVYATTPEIYAALKSFKPESIDGMMKYLGEIPARWMRAGAVIYNPAFVAKNAFRDQLTAYLFSEYGYKPFYDMAKGIYHILKKDELYQEFKTSGTLMSTIVNSAKDFSGELLKDAQRTPKEKVFRKLNPLANLEALSNYAEMGTRMGLYAKARKSGASIIDATMEAREGTLDFGKAGIKGKAANRYMPFFNATIQDTALLVEKFKKNPARMAQRLAPMVLGSLAIYAFIRSHDDLSREYDELMPYERNMFWNIPVPKSVCETGWLRFPKPFGPGFLFGSLPERLADLAGGHDKNGKQMKEWAKGYLESLVPGAMPPLIQAGIEWGSGYSFFRERDIVPAREKELDPRDQYGPDTSTFAKWAGEKTGLSPRKIDNAGQNLFAGAYGGVTGLHDAVTEGKKVNLPWETLKLDPWKSPQSTQDYYDRRKEVREAQKSNKAKGRPISREDMKDYERTVDVDKKLKTYNAKLRKAQEAHNDDETRRLKREIAQMLDRELSKFERR